MSSMSVEARCFKSLVPLLNFERKDFVLTQSIDKKPRFCTYQVNGKTKMQRCNHGVHMRRQCDNRLSLFNANSSLRKTYLNNYRSYK